MLNSLKEIIQLIQNGESQTVELKTSFGKDKIEFKGSPKRSFLEKQAGIS